MNADPNQEAPSQARYPPDKGRETVETAIERAEKMCREWGEAA